MTVFVNIEILVASDILEVVRALEVGADRLLKKTTNAILSCNLFMGRPTLPNRATS